MYDIVIIGSGPAGLSAAIYAGRAKLSALVVERDAFGLGAIAVTEQVDNYPGLQGIGGYELGEIFRKQAEAFGAEFLEANITAIRKTDAGFLLERKYGEPIAARAVIYAAGASYRRLDAPGATLNGVSYCATCDGAFYQGKTVAVIGGGDTALEDALYLSRIAAKVYLVHRRAEFRANQTAQALVRETPNIELVLEAVPAAVIGEKRVEALEITQDGTQKTLDVDGVFLAIGSIPNTALLEGIAELDAQGYVIAGEDGVTSLEGLFAAGDVRTKPLRQVVTAAADGANCVQSAERWLRKGSHSNGEHL